MFLNGFKENAFYPRIGWDAKENVVKYRKNSQLQTDWAYSVIGKHLSPTKNELILDFGCGDGKITYLLSCLAKGVIGVDISNQMIREAHCHYGQNDNIGFVTLETFSKNSYKYRNYFHHATAFCMLHLVANPRHFLDSVNDTLKPGGTFVCTLPMTNNHYFSKALSDTCRKHRFALPVKSADRKMVQTAGGFKELAKASGFAVQSIEQVKKRNAFNSESEMIDWFEGTFSANIGLPLTKQKRFNTDLVRKYLELDDESRGDGDVVYYSVDRLDAKICKL